MVNGSFAFSSPRYAVENNLGIQIAGLSDSQIEASRMNYNYLSHFVMKFNEAEYFVYF